MPLHHMGHYGTGPSASANQAIIGAALTDSTTGTAGTTLAAGVGITQVGFAFTLASVVAAGELVTDYTLGYKFKILAVDFAVTVVVTTGAKRCDFVVDIGATEMTGGLVSVTSAAATPVGTVVAGTAVTAGNTGSAAATISIRSETVTAHVEGAGVLLLTIQNMDTADAVASLAARANSVRTLLNQIRSDLITNDIIKGSA